MSAPQILSAPASGHVIARNGDRLPLRLWRPAVSPRRAVVALHGMVTHSGWFAQLGELLAARDIALLAPDRRGNGEATGLGGVGEIALLCSDLAEVVRLARTLADEVELLSWCGSANFALPAALELPVSRLLLASPGLVPLPEKAAKFRAAEPSRGFLPLHFDPASDFTDDAATRLAIRADPLTLRRIPEELRGAWRTLNPLARRALAQLPMPARCALTRVDRMIDIPATVELIGAMPLHWAEGGHGFLVEPQGARFIADLLEQP